MRVKAFFMVVLLCASMLLPNMAIAMTQHDETAKSKEADIMGDFPNITPKVMQDVDGRYGFVDESGVWLIKPQYESIDLFIDGLAKVKLNDTWGFVDEMGKIVIEPKYDWISDFSVSDFSEDKAMAILGGQPGTLSKSGQFDPGDATQEHAYYIPHSYYIRPYYGYDYYNHNYNSVGFSTDTSVIIIPKYDEVAPFHSGGSGLAGVKLNDKWGYIDLRETVIIEFLYDDANMFFGGLAAVKLNSKWGFIDTTGNIVIDFQYDNISANTDTATYYGNSGFEGGLARVKLNGKWGLINKKGEYILEPQYDFIKGFQGGFAIVKLDGKYGFIDETGKLIADVQYEDVAIDQMSAEFGMDVQGFSCGLAGVKLNGKWGYIDTTGKVVIEFQFDNAYSFWTEGNPNLGDTVDVADVVLNGEYGRIDKSGAFLD